MAEKNSNAGYTRIQIVPIGVELLNQSDFSGSIVLLQSFFSLNRVFSIIELFEIDQPVDLIFLREAFHQFQAMFGDATSEIIGHADVERASDSAGQNVYVEAT